VSLAREWRDVQAKLPDGWSSTGLRIQFEDRPSADSAAALLAPAQPYRPEPTVLRFLVARDGTSVGPEAATRLLRRVDDARLHGSVTIGETQRAPERVQRAATSLAAAWEAALAGLPADWSDLFAEVELTSSDFVERAAVLCVQMNPRREGTRAAFRFRCARRAGYGVSPEMARRCFERCDAEKITGTVVVLRVMSDSRLVATQGPVWMVGGRNV
jgi:hypothetical protein